MVRAFRARRAGDGTQQFAIKENKVDSVTVHYIRSSTFVKLNIHVVAPVWLAVLLCPRHMQSQLILFSYLFFSNMNFYERSLLITATPLLVFRHYHRCTTQRAPPTSFKRVNPQLPSSLLLLTFTFITTPPSPKLQHRHWTATKKKKENVHEMKQTKAISFHFIPCIAAKNERLLHHHRV